MPKKKKKENSNATQNGIKAQKTKLKATEIISVLYKNGGFVILLTALCVNTIIILFYVKSPFSRVPVWDSEVYWNAALKIANGNFLGDSIFHQAPLYPYFLALIVTVFGKSYIAVFIIQIFLTTLSSFLIYLICKKILSGKIAIAAALLYSFYGMQIFYSLKLLSETLSIFLMLLSIFLLLYTNRKRFIVSSGILFGLLCLSKPNMLLALPFAVLHIYLSSNKSLFVRNSVILFVSAFSIISLATIRNFIVGGDFVLISSNGGENFYIGNHTGATGTFTGIEGVSRDIEYQNADVVSVAEKETGKKLTRSQVSSFWFHKGVEFIKSSPTKAAFLSLKKFLYIFSGRERSTMYYLYFEEKTFTQALGLAFLSFPFLFPFALVGAVALFRKKQLNTLIVSFPLVIALGMVIFFYDTRFRLLLIPFLTIYAGAGIIVVYSLIRDIIKLKKWQWLSIVTFLFGIGISGTVHLVEKKEKLPDWHMWLTLGDIYYKMHKLDYALEAYTKSCELKKDDWMPVFGAAKVFFDKGKRDVGKDLYKEAFENLNADFKTLILRDEELDPIRNYISETEFEKH